MLKGSSSPEVGNSLGCKDGGEEEDRTPDLRIANATLSQLSYPPTESPQSIKRSVLRRP